MKVFVTGGTGFIGGHVVRQLRERGDEVRALVRSPEKGERARPSSAVSWSRAPLPTRTRIRAGMEGCDAVIHGAAMYEVGIPEVRAPGDVRGERDRHRERAAAPRSTRSVGQGRLHLDRRRLRQHQGPGRRRDLRASRRRLHLLLRGDQGRGPPAREAPDRRGGAAVRDRPARRRLRARRPLGARPPDEPVPRRARCR